MVVTKIQICSFIGPWARGPVGVWLSLKLNSVASWAHGPVGPSNIVAFKIQLGGWIRGRDSKLLYKLFKFVGPILIRFVDAIRLIYLWLVYSVLILRFDL